MDSLGGPTTVMTKNPGEETLDELRILKTECEAALLNARSPEEQSRFNRLLQQLNACIDQVVAELLFQADLEH